MKKATVASTAVWTGAALLLIGEQFASRRWPFIAHPPVANAITFAGIGIVAASMALMKNVDARDVLPSRSNTSKRNLLNAVNFIAAISAALSFGILAGLFSPVPFHSRAFAVLATILMVGIAVQAVFALMTNSEPNRLEGQTTS